MRVLFCGSGLFAVPTIRAILDGEHELVGMITQPARPAGRGGKPRRTPVAEAAADLGLPVTVCENINAESALADVRRLSPDVICVADFGQFLGKAIRQAAPLGAFNLHGSLLPELRGAAPVNWAIIRGCRRTGVTSFSLVDRMDAGPIYVQQAAQINPEETAEELRQRLAQLGAALARETLDMLAAGQAQVRQQDESKATFAPLLRKSDGRIDFSCPAETVRNLIHGTWPWPGGQAIFRQGKDRAVPVTIARAAADPAPVDAEPGTLDDDLLVATGEGRLRIRQIQPAGKRLMEWRDFVNGYRVRRGDQLTPVGDD